MKKSELKKQVAAAIQACLEKKAEELSILEMEKGSGAFTDYFVLCSGTNPRQVQAIADEVELRLKAASSVPNSIEGYKQAEWVLIDYVDFVVHVFSEKARKFYDLERLWKTAKRLEARRPEDGAEEDCREEESGVEQSANEQGRGDEEEESESLELFLRDSGILHDIATRLQAGLGNAVPAGGVGEVEGQVCRHGPAGDRSAGGIFATGTGHAGARSGQRYWRTCNHTGVSRGAQRTRNSARLERGSAGDCGATSTDARVHELSSRSRQMPTVCLFPTQSFDLAASRFGVMFFSEPRVALRELRRSCVPARGPVFWPGVRLINHTGQSMMGVVHRHVGGRLLVPSGSNPFRFSERGSLSAVLRSAGFNSVEEETKRLPWTWPGPVEEVWEQAQSVAVPFVDAGQRIPAGSGRKFMPKCIRRCGVLDGEKVAFGASVVLASGKK